MPETQTVWLHRSEPFTRVVRAVTDWDAPSPCEGWTARDVLNHVMDTQRDFLAQRGHPVAEPPGDDPAARWQAHQDAVMNLLADPAVAGEQFEGFFGPTTVGAVLTGFYGFDLIPHRWDIARSQGADEPFTSEEIVEIEASMDGWGEHAYGQGIFEGPLEVPANASDQTRALAMMGRRS